MRDRLVQRHSRPFPLGPFGREYLFSMSALLPLVSTNVLGAPRPSPAAVAHIRQAILEKFGQDFNENVARGPRGQKGEGQFPAGVGKRICPKWSRILAVAPQMT